MSKVKKQTKTHLIVEKTFKIQTNKNIDNDMALNILFQKAKEKKAKFGLNSVFKTAKKDELKLAVIPRIGTFTEPYQPLFNLLASKRIPILSLDIDDFDFAQKFHGMKKLLVLGLICDIPEELKGYVQYIETSNDLPPVTLEVDTYSVDASKISNRRH